MIQPGRAPGTPNPERSEPRPPAVMAQVLDAFPVGVGLFDAPRDDFRFAYGNGEFCRLLAMDQAPRAGSTVEEVFTRADRDAVVELFRRVRTSREPRSFFAAEGAETGETERVWNLDAYPVFDEGRVTQVLVLLQQTREKLGTRQRQEREADRLRAKADELASLEKAKSEFLHLASHELRGPAAMLRGYLSMIEDGSLGPVPEGLLPVLPVLKAKASQINLLANEMVEAARLEDRRLQLKLKPVDLREALRRCLQNAEATLTAKHRFVVLDRVKGPVTVMADRMRLDIIVSNLIDNAIKYSPEGGDIDVLLEVTGELAIVTVRDPGIGIAAEDMSRLFVRFSRVGARSDVPGTGLGLYLARELARLHGGDIMAISKLGQGSDFTLTLPVVTDRPS